MQQGTFAEAIRLCTEATGTNVRVLRAYKDHQEVFSAQGSYHSDRFWGHDVPWRDAENAAGHEAMYLNSPSDRGLSWLGRHMKERGLDGYAFHCACLPHQFYSWWGEEHEWPAGNGLAVIELDVNDLIVLNQQVLVLRGKQQRVIREWID